MTVPVSPADPEPLAWYHKDGSRCENPTALAGVIGANVCAEHRQFLTLEGPAAAVGPEPIERCPRCKHAPHERLGFCPNLASDNDCGCQLGAAAVGPEPTAPTEQEWIDQVWALRWPEDSHHFYANIAPLIERVRAAERARTIALVAEHFPYGECAICDAPYDGTSQSWAAHIATAVARSHTKEPE